MQCAIFPNSALQARCRQEITRSRMNLADLPDGYKYSHISENPMRDGSKMKSPKSKMHMGVK